MNDSGSATKRTFVRVEPRSRREPGPRVDTTPPTEKQVQLAVRLRIVRSEAEAQRFSRGAGRT